MKAVFTFIVILYSSMATAVQTLSSGIGQKVLLELYTSEGCSSCPPMDHYLASYRENKNLWEIFVPVAFHVDYWDYIGWQDRYAAPEFTTRQQHHAREHNTRSVYTPALIVNGNGWRPGLFSTEPTFNTQPAGNLDVVVDKKNISAKFRPVLGDANRLDLHIALLGLDIKTKVSAGENNGRVLKHEFVVIGFKTLRGINGRWHTSLPDLHYKGAAPQAIAAWVTRANSLKPLQAVGGYLD